MPENRSLWNWSGFFRQYIRWEWRRGRRRRWQWGWGSGRQRGCCRPGRRRRRDHPRVRRVTLRALPARVVRWPVIRVTRLAVRVRRVIKGDDRPVIRADVAVVALSRPVSRRRHVAPRAVQVLVRVLKVDHVPVRHIVAHQAFVDVVIFRRCRVAVQALEWRFIVQVIRLQPVVRDVA